MFQIIKGDLLDAQADILCHQVNCRNVMGAGIAKAIYTKWPIVKTEYHKFCKRFLRPKDLLGLIQIVPVSDRRAVVNIFGQMDYGRSKDIVYTDYKSLAEAFSEINRIFYRKTIAFPYRFGCGLAGGDWITVKGLMFDYLKDCHIQIYVKG